MAANQPDLSVIKVFGKWLEDGNKTPTGKKCLLKFKSTAPDNKPSKGQLKQGLTFAVDGNGAKPEILFSHVKDPEDDEHTAVAYFVPLKQGPQKITIRYNGRKLKAEPLVIEAVGPDADIEKMLSKVTVHGRVELGKAFTANEFVVDCSGVQPPIGTLKVHIKGPPRSSAALNIVDNENGSYRIIYKPTSTGMYNISIKIADNDIPGSPFQVRVTEFLSTK